MKPDTRGRTCQHVKTTLIKQIVVPRGVKVRSSPQIIDGVAPTVELSKFHSRCQPGRLRRLQSLCTHPLNKHLTLCSINYLN